MIAKKYKEEYLNKALTYQLLDDNAKALESLDESLKIDLNFAEALIGKGNSYLKLDQKDKALLYLKNKEENEKIMEEKKKKYI